ncbi:MAG: A/G-specific adenine glycosylase [Spirochaetaceae bacterium]|nr:A/G-specific adenine glycosylase [Spirochaetaceae bacterium]
MTRIFLTAAQIAEFQERILEYYRRHGRDFPWRHTTDPYEILVSEVMLQQTQTDRVASKYGPWLRAFPTVGHLAGASLAEALGHWNGLGYNRRARFLREACRIIVTQMAGVFPRKAEELDALPGIGAYTARAVCSFAFNRPEVFIETNIRAAFLHCFFGERLASPETPVHDREILPLVEATLFRESPRLWYYALMDYGAAVKKARPNPNRASIHYVRQSPFAGSLREARGAIIRRLSTGGINQNGVDGITLGDIAEAEGMDYGRMEQAAAALVAEGMVTGEGDLYRIGDQ